MGVAWFLGIMKTKMLYVLALGLVLGCGKGTTSNDVFGRNPEDDVNVEIQWETKRVLSQGLVGEWTHLLLDASGNPGIAHYCAAHVTKDCLGSYLCRSGISHCSTRQLSQ